MSLFSHFHFESMNASKAEAFEAYVSGNALITEALGGLFSPRSISKMKTILYIPLYTCRFSSSPVSDFSEAYMPTIAEKAAVTFGLMLTASLKLSMNSQQPHIAGTVWAQYPKKGRKIKELWGRGGL